MNRRCPIVRWWCLLRIMNVVFVLETKWVPSTKMVLQAGELFWWGERLWAVGVCIGCLGEWHFGPLLGWRDFSPQEGHVLFWLEIVERLSSASLLYILSEPRGIVPFFGAHLNHLRQPRKTQFPHYKGSQRYLAEECPHLWEKCETSKPFKTLILWTQGYLLGFAFCIIKALQSTFLHSSFSIFSSCPVNLG